MAAPASRSTKRHVGPDAIESPEIILPLSDAVLSTALGGFGHQRLGQDLRLGVHRIDTWRRLASLRALSEAIVGHPQLFGLLEVYCRHQRNLS